ncbi:hypothetical protein C5167_023599 [Papaver somniferum]|uniref:Uncharacterized protein n=1 Tax=Papaver somniferum TaxID=3469 RepID=A0A4Y7JP90_PAPSO|nr:hypothetical protein C5167_023599 [Papaver somniferum]
MDDMSRDTYGFVVRPQHPKRYQEYAIIFKEDKLQNNCPPAAAWIDEGTLKESEEQHSPPRVSSQFENTMIHAAHEIFNGLLPDVHIFTDHKVGDKAGKICYSFFVLYARKIFRSNAILNIYKANK